MSAVRILVVDDSPQFLEAATQFLKAAPNVEVVGTATSGMLALEHIERLNPDFVLVDVSMPGMDGWETTRRLRTKYGEAGNSQPGIIILSLAESHGYATAAEEAGADGFVAKSEFHSQLLPLLESLLPRPTQSVVPTTSVPDGDVHGCQTLQRQTLLVPAVEASE